MKQIAATKSFNGTQYVFSHRSEACQCDMTFAVYMPPQAASTKVPILWYLSGLTCTHQNVMDKGEYRQIAAELGIAIICPDTSPRGDDVPDEPDNWQFGKGAGFYLDATEYPYGLHYNMETYVVQELPRLLDDNGLALDFTRQSIFGHSMGGHGAITLALKNPEGFASVSAFAPIAQPSTADWSRPSFEKYLGTDQAAWRSYDSTLLIEDGYRVKEILVDQGTADPFLEMGLRPQLLSAACQKAGIPFTLNMREGYDHSYLFISTFMEDHIRWHAERLVKNA
ncbi:S-formylglutathione hydrolase (plasmid) [Agrobacterium sp. 13-2099-1-2]|uniref:S-formylglutathione hydrolase n=1 Tax=Agrobacterium sp. 13-2099-1-2 TaxID=1841651 RepID=UPI00080F7BCB|nr:S-formylglutathione hydrolase [Agrobacterium sp. 13-2099-1-2]UZX45254.1 S-formylglutathione hydrolase [Agrobacterium sp. 13-2099-1-2]